MQVGGTNSTAERREVLVLPPPLSVTQSHTCVVRNEEKVLAGGCAVRKIGQTSYVFFFVVRFLVQCVSV